MLKKNIKQTLYHLILSPILILSLPFFIASVFIASVSLASSRPADDNFDFTTLSLEELKDVRITSASRKPEKFSETAAAIFVITGDEIRRSGATSIPEALRLSPGVQVARISATEWAVNIRGLNEQYSNKLLVLMDGRNVYNHVYSGVFWDIQDTVMEDIDRIEIIRGPGILWGANAVNGVISIITKHPEQTQGGQWTLLGGNEEGVGTFRYGGKQGTDGFYRLYAKCFHRGGLFDSRGETDGDPSAKDWRAGRGGFRYDWKGGHPADRFTLQGELFSNIFENETVRRYADPVRTEAVSEKSRAKGGHLTGGWERRFSEKSSMDANASFDYYDKDTDGGGGIAVHTLNLDFLHRMKFWGGNDLVWGIDWRFTRDRFRESADLTIDPGSFDQHLYSLFTKTRFSLIPPSPYQTLNLLAGVKFEHNHYTGWEFQPDVRLQWRPRRTHTFWASVSRAVRVPSRMEFDGLLYGDFLETETTSEASGLRLAELGNENLETEVLMAYEIGYSFEPDDAFWLNLSVFLNDYSDLIGFRKQETADSGDLLTVGYENNTSGESFGAEIAAYWQIFPFWRLQAGYTFLETRMDPTVSGGEYFEDSLAEGTYPRNQLSLRSSVNFGKTVETDLWFRFVDRLVDNDVDAYASLDLRLAWKPGPGWELAVVGQNLLEPEHPEFSSLEIERSFYVRVSRVF